MLRSGSLEHACAGSARSRRRCRRPPAAPSASPSTRSIADTWPRFATTPAASCAARNGSATALLAKPAMFGRSRLPSSNAGNGAGPLAVDDAHHLLGRDAVGRHRGDERARARADVDVEVVDRAVDGQQVERAQRADLVDAAGEAAAAEHERGLRALRAPRGLAAGPVLGLRLELDDLAHGQAVYGARGRWPAAAPGSRRTFDRPVLLSIRWMRRAPRNAAGARRRSPAPAPAAAYDAADLRSTLAREMRARDPVLGRLRARPGLRRASSSRCARRPPACRPRSRSSTRPRRRCCAWARPRRSTRAPSATARARRRRRPARRPRARRRRRPVLRRRVGGAARARGEGGGRQAHRRRRRRRRERLRPPALELLHAAMTPTSAACSARWPTTAASSRGALQLDAGALRGRRASPRSCARPACAARREPRAGTAPAAAGEIAQRARRCPCARSSASSTCRRTTSPPRCC